MEPEGSIRYSQEPTTGPYPEPYQTNPHQGMKQQNTYKQTQTLQIIH
jgi:hypothetical protein